MCYKIQLVIFLISVVICSVISRNTESRAFWNQVTNWNETSEAPSNGTAHKDKVQLKLYYETLCPASVDFFVAQLKPAVKRLGSHLDVHLIPYGHAKTFHAHGKYSFKCQHGSRECYANMVHACAIDVLRNNTRALYFNGCLMQYTSYDADYEYFVSVLRWCGYTEDVHLYEIWKCVDSTRGAILLKDYGEETHQLKPSYVPYLVLDGSTEFQNEAERNLVGTVCQMLEPRPAACFNHT